jgi:hypothetical protein
MPFFIFLLCYFLLFFIINFTILSNDVNFKKLIFSRRVFLHFLLVLLPQLTWVFILLAMFFLNSWGKLIDDRVMYFVIVVSGLCSFLIMQKLLKHKISNSIRLLILEIYPHLLLCSFLLFCWWYLLANWSLRF